MLIKTHLAISVFAIILFFPYVNYPIQFIFLALFATVLPDFDTRFSKYGKNYFARVLQFFTKHRGMLHSITLCTLLSLLLAIFTPILAFGFFLGYSLHLLADSFTEKGIPLFWPLKYNAKGFIKTGGVVEKGIFFTIIIADFLLVIVRAL
jgi:inner membrane protein